MNTKAQVIWKTIGIGITAGLLVAAMIWGVRMTPSEDPCQSLGYIIKDRNERLYLSEAELSRLLQAENIYPVGRRIDHGLLHRIEHTILSHPMVRTAECYLTPANVMKIQITQRVPLLRVRNAEDMYIIDTDHRVMQARAAVRDSVLVVTGNVSVKTASSGLAEFAEWLQDEPYWRNMIGRVYVQNPYQFFLYMKKPDTPCVLLGDLRGYDRKLAKLRTFFENGVEETADKKYRVLDIRFRGQVIGKP